MKNIFNFTFIIFEITLLGFIGYLLNGMVYFSFIEGVWDFRSIIFIIITFVFDLAFIVVIFYKYNKRYKEC